MKRRSTLTREKRATKKDQRNETRFSDRQSINSTTKRTLRLQAQESSLPEANYAFPWAGYRLDDLRPHAARPRDNILSFFPQDNVNAKLLVKEEEKDSNVEDIHSMGPVLMGLNNDLENPSSQQNKDMYRQVIIL